ncbi:hypothetical protein [Virgibacillus sp. SK37]|uniref:hypothetical protein n=1 Tax=Virgibacillus sp. SK37 TaxID=403957 RepID=UPI0004D1109A|nr:hypothetical protein [Virgibacillus sp. SK37]AIF42889.1 hypothetical protein X953_06460 [Virgibacillus sp. SK37]
MKKIVLILILFGIPFVVAACTSDEAVQKEITLPKDVPEFVTKAGFDNIDWEKEAVEFGDKNIIGNENKSGVIGVDMPSLDGQKWMWHLWGIENPENTEFTVVGFHKETGTVHHILKEGWSTSLSGANNGADAHTPSSVKIPDPGKWAVLLYTDDELFDILIYEIDE